jgi:hypothetical protein
MQDLSDYIQGTYSYEFGEQTTQRRTEVIAATNCDRIALEISRLYTDWKMEAVPELIQMPSE